LQRKCQPLGLILEEVEDGNGAVVKGFTEGSNGQRLGVKIGETLVACRQVQAAACDNCECLPPKKTDISLPAARIA
jgi:S1-C subfamily serine protease